MVVNGCLVQQASELKGFPIDQGAFAEIQVAGGLGGEIAEMLLRHNGSIAKNPSQAGSAVVGERHVLKRIGNNHPGGGKVVWIAVSVRHHCIKRSGTAMWRIDIKLSPALDAVLNPFENGIVL